MGKELANWMPFYCRSSAITVKILSRCSSNTVLLGYRQINKIFHCDNGMDISKSYKTEKSQTKQTKELKTCDLSDLEFEVRTANPTLTHGLIQLIQS